ncbi:MAG: type II toxin-antitoxin system VapC family toxin [Chloroflexaceae bacterium]|jgi:tRNA(fMet)-specific endonuclease VapC|nr:type II toxin-antitoxin system VapC family toxin [Chloroflexaceae bacterium]
MTVSPPLTLLDTDTLSAVMRRQPTAVAHAQTYLATHRRFSFALITRYEILRGLYAKRATAQLVRFENLCVVSDVLPLNDTVAVRAATIYADLHQRGELIGDADILIAATALEHGLMLATNNTNHFKRITGLSLVNWLV